MSVKGKTVLVTGASRGLGRAAAEAFLRAGAEVVATGRDAKALSETEAALKAIGGTFRLATLEVTDEAAVRALINSLDRLDVLINNAGIAEFRPFLETTTEDFRRMLEVNVVGAFVVMRESMRKMKVTGGGDVINIASDGAVRGLPGMAHYSTSKHALLGLGRSVRLELRTQGFRVTTLCPGPVDTTIVLPEGVEGGIEPGELAETLVHIASAGRSMLLQELLIEPSQMETYL